MYTIRIIFTLAISFAVGAAIAHKGEKHTPPPDTGDMKPLLKKINLDYLAKVKPIFKTKCLDCHSDQTRFPWYYSLPLLRGFIDSDIEEAKEHLNMSNDFPFSGHGSPYEDLDEIKEVVVKNEMPPSLYKIMHWDSWLSEKDKDAIVAWVERSQKLLNNRKTISNQTD